jgi:hypothetical protein
VPTGLRSGGPLKCWKWSGFCHIGSNLERSGVKSLEAYGNRDLSAIVGIRPCPILPLSIFRGGGHGLDPDECECAGVRCSCSPVRRTVRGAEGEADEWQVAVTWTGWGLTVGGGAQVQLETLFWDGDRGQVVMQEVPNEAPQIGSDEPIDLPGQPLFMVAALGVLAGVLARILAGVKSRLMVSAVGAFVAAGALALGLRGVLRHFDPPPYDEAMSAVPAAGFWLAVGILALLRRRQCDRRVPVAEARRSPQA